MEAVSTTPTRSLKRRHCVTITSIIITQRDLPPSRHLPSPPLLPPLQESQSKLRAPGPQDKKTPALAQTPLWGNRGGGP